MSTNLNAPGSSAVITVADELVERYTAQGWTIAGTEPDEKPLAKMNKTELVAEANGLGLDADESLTKKDLVELIEAARSEESTTDADESGNSDEGDASEESTTDAEQ